MKAILLILFAQMSIASIAQDSLNKIVTGPAARPSVIIMPMIMKEKDVIKILSEKNDPEINKRLIKSRNSKHLQYVGFLAIPAGIIGTTYIMSSNFQTSAPTRREIYTLQLSYGLVALVPICVSASIYFKYNRNYNYKKAIHRYNNLYN